MTRSTRSREQPGRARSRRRFIATAGVGLAGVLAGCTDDGLGVGVQTGPSYEAGTVDVPADAEDRSPEEMATAEALAEQESQEGVTPLEDLSVVEHEFVFEDDFRGSTVQGTVENTGERIELVEVRVRVYDETGAQLGRYLATTGDLDHGAEWSFEVILLESPGDISEYDIAVIGTPT